MTKSNMSSDKNKKNGKNDHCWNDEEKVEQVLKYDEKGHSARADNARTT